MGAYEDAINIVKESKDVDEVRPFALVAMGKVGNLEAALADARASMLVGASEQQEAVIEDFHARVLDRYRAENVRLALAVLFGSVVGQTLDTDFEV